MLHPSSLPPQTRLLLALLQYYQSSSLPFPPPPYPTASSTVPSTHSTNLPTPNVNMTNTNNTNTGVNASSHLEQADDGPPEIPIEVHVNASTRIVGNNNRLLIPSHALTEEQLTKLVRVSMKGLDTSTGTLEIKVDATLKVEGSGNMVMVRDPGAVVKKAGEVEGKKRMRASSVSTP